MNYLTNYYKNLCEQLQEKVNQLQRLINEEGDMQKDAKDSEKKSYVSPPFRYPHENDPDAQKKIEETLRKAREKAEAAKEAKKAKEEENKTKEWDEYVADYYKDADPETKIKELEQEKERRSTVQRRKIIDAEIASLKRLMAKKFNK